MRKLERERAEIRARAHAKVAERECVQAIEAEQRAQADHAREENNRAQRMQMEHNANQMIEDEICLAAEERLVEHQLSLDTA